MEELLQIDGFLSGDECRELIQLTEAQGYEPASIISDGAPVLAPEIRNNERVIIDSPKLAETWWSRLPAEIVASQENWAATRLNERMRFYRYSKSQQFRMHRDFPYQSGNEVSRLSLIVYLNQGFSGGETDFLSTIVEPKTGKAIIFPHNLLHSGLVVTNGIKYAVRTDIMGTSGV